MTVFNDISPFFDSDLSIESQYHKNGFTESVPIPVIFDAEAEHIENDIILVKPRIVVKSIDVVGISKKDRFQIKGIWYKVYYPRPDDNGMREIYLTVDND